MWWRRFLHALLVAWHLVPAPHVPPAPPGRGAGVPVRTDRQRRAPGPAAQFVGCVNDVRRRAGVAPVGWHRTLAADAEAWTEHMVRDGALSHSYAWGGWRGGYIGENVGRTRLAGDRVAILCAAFDASPEHHAVMVNPRYRFVGVGVVDDGTWLWVTERLGG